MEAVSILGHTGIELLLFFRSNIFRGKSFKIKLYGREGGFQFMGYVSNEVIVQALPPRTIAARVCSSTYSSVHCHTLPVISITPNGLAPAGCASTSAGPGRSRPLYGVGTAPSSHELPHGYSRPSVPSAAYCHSHSCGSRLPAHAA